MPRPVVRFLLCLLFVPGAFGALDPRPCAAATVQVRGAVVDSTTGSPILAVSIRWEADTGDVHASDLTDPHGRFELRLPAAVAGSLRARHAAYETSTMPLELRGIADTVRLTIRLHPRVYRVEEYLVHGERVVPLTKGDETRYSFPRGAVRALGIDRTNELISRLPGAVLLGDRPFFRGTGFEHVLPLLDGVPAREPVRGQWVLPPPDAILVGQLAPGGFDAEYGQALAGVFSVELPDGGPRHQFRVGAEGDHLLRLGGSSRKTDLLRGALSGPIGLDGVTYAGSWQVRLTDTDLRYDHALPEQSLAGLGLGRRTSGEVAGLARLSWADSARSRRAALTWLHSESRAKGYQHHYSRAGWVGYDPIYDRFTTFVDPALTTDSVIVAYDAPRGVPTRFRSSRLLQVTASLPLTGRANVRASVRAAEHRSLARAEGLAFATEEEARAWVRGETTRMTHQVERFYAVHGDYPEYEDGRSREVAAAAHLRGRTGGHELAAGGGITVGRHRLFLATPAIDWTTLGSLTEEMQSEDLFGYLQDTWRSDAFASMTMALRWDRQSLQRCPGRGSGSTLSPRLAFRQPCGTRDALHVQAGVLYQFPALLELFQSATTVQPHLTLRAQRGEAVEIGLQHHFSKRAVGYVAVHVREYTDIVFTSREASDEDLLEAGQSAPKETPELVSRGVELLLDHQFHRLLSGQLRVEGSRQEYRGSDVPWGRALVAAGWLIAQPFPSAQIALAGRWDSGRPYSVCLRARGCSEAERYEGRLPDLFELDLSTRWRVPRARGMSLLLEVRNLLDRRVPNYDFGIYGSGVGIGNFIAYYDRYGRAGGYLVDSGREVWRFDLDHPQTRTAGRAVQLGVEYEM